MGYKLLPNVFNTSHWPCVQNIFNFYPKSVFGCCFVVVVVVVVLSFFPEQFKRREEP